MKPFKINRFIIIGIAIGSLVGITAIFVLPPYFAQDEPTVPHQVKIGLSYFSGDQPLSNHGAPCVSCHNIVSMGFVGNNLAPDLSKAFLEPPTWYEDLPDFEGDETKLTSFLNNPSTKTMRLIWPEGPLNSSEVESLVNLLRYASSQD